jgi:hypothetical protein
MEKRIAMENALEGRQDIRFVGELKEAYFTSDDESPCLVVTGASEGTGPVEIRIRGVGLLMEGRTIGSKYIISIEEEL